MKIRIFGMVAFAALTACSEVTRWTEWQDVPDETLVGTVLDIGDNKKLDLPPFSVTNGWIPVSIGGGKATWQPNPGGGGGGSLGKVTQLQDENGNWHNVSSSWNSVTLKYDLVIDPNVAPHEEMTVQQEAYRAVMAETDLDDRLTAETAARMIADLDLDEKISAISSLGRFISTWNCATGKPGTEPLGPSIVYQSGDYYIVGAVSTGKNYIPHGLIYYKDSTSTVEATDVVSVNDVYRFTEDGTWLHIAMSGISVTWENIAGEPTNSVRLVNTINSLSRIVTTNTVTKEYIDGLGLDKWIEKPDEYVMTGNVLVKGVYSNETEWVKLESCDTNKVNDLIATYDATNIYPRATNTFVRLDGGNNIPGFLNFFSGGSNEMGLAWHSQKPGSLPARDPAWKLYFDYDTADGSLNFKSAPGSTSTYHINIHRNNDLYSVPYSGSGPKYKYVHRGDLANTNTLGVVKIGYGINLGLNFFKLDRGDKPPAYIPMSLEDALKTGIDQIRPIYFKNAIGEFELFENEYITRRPTTSISNRRVNLNYIRGGVIGKEIVTWTSDSEYEYNGRISAVSEARVAEIVQDIISSNKTSQTSQGKVMRLSTSSVDINTTNIGNLETNKVNNPATSVPAGYALVRGTTNLTEWVQLPATNIVGYLGYIRDLSNNAYRVIAETNPEGSIVASIEQTPTPMPIITIDEEYARATNAEARLYASVTNMAGCATNYTDAAALAATNYTDAAAIAATNYTDIVATNVAICATNYTDIAALMATNYTHTVATNVATCATNYADVSFALSTNYTHTAFTNAAECATNYTDSATNALRTASDAKYLTISPDRNVLITNGMALVYQDGASFYSVYSGNSDGLTFRRSGAGVSRLVPDNSNIVTSNLLVYAVDTATNAVYVLSTNYTDNATNALLATVTPRINERALTNDFITATNALTTAIGDEEDARTASDTALWTGIGEVDAARVAGDTNVAHCATNYTDSVKTALDADIAAEATARADADALLIPLAQKAAANGVATLDANVKVPYAQIPNDAKNMQVYEALESFPPVIEGITNRLYVAKDTGNMYRFDPVLGYIKLSGGGGGEGVTNDYSVLINKPQIGGVTLVGNKTLSMLNIQPKLPAYQEGKYLHVTNGVLEWAAVSGGTGTSDYAALSNKPKIGGVELLGDKTPATLGLQSNLVFTAADNGKVLGVVNTNLMWVTGGGGSGDYREKTDLSVYEVENFDISQIRTTLGDPSIQIILADEELIKEEIPGKTQRWDYYFFNSTNEIVGVTVNQFMTKAEALAATSIYVEDFEGHVYTMNRKTAETFKTNEKLVTTWDEGKIKGYAGLDDSARVKIAQLPEDVKNVYDYPTMADFPQWSGRRENRIYIARDTNKAYRFDNTTSQYVELAGSSVGGTWGSISGSITNQVDLYTILTNKRDLADRQWIHDTTTPWTSTSSDAALDAILNDRTKYPDGAWRYAGSQSWTCDYGTGPTDAYIMQINTGGDYNQTYIEFMFRKRATSDTVFGTATRSFTKGENFVIETELEKGLRGKRDIYDLYIPGKLINGCLPVSISGTEVDNADLTVEKSYGNYTVYAYRGKSNEKEVCQTDASGDLTSLGSDVLLGGYTPSIGDHVLQVDDFIVDGSYVNANLQTQLVHTAAENGKVLGVTNNTIAWVTQTGGGGSVTNAAYREKIDYAYYAEDYYDLEPLKTALGIDYAYLVLADEKFRKQSTSTHWRWYMYNADFEMIGRSQEYSSPENAHASIINVECALGWAFLYKKAIPGNGIKTNRRIITEYEAGIEGGYQTNLIVSASDNGKVLGIANNKLSWVEGGSGGLTDTLILNGDEDIITGPYVIPHGYGEEGQMLVSKGTNAPPEWSDQPMMVLNGTITNAIGPVVIPGGYGQKGQILIGNNNSSPTWLSSGTIGSILTSNGEGANPSWIAGATAGDILVCGGANASPSWKGLETASITRDSTSSGGLTVRKMGRFCTISVNQLASTSGGGGTAALVGTISGTNYLPVDDYFGVSITPINGGSSAYLLIRNESSTMKVYIKGHTSGTKYYGSGFYITK